VQTKLRFYDRTVWVFGSVGDIDPFNYGGGFVVETPYGPELEYIDRDTDDPELEYIDRDTDDPTTFTVYRVTLEEDVWTQFDGVDWRAVARTADHDIWDLRDMAETCDPEVRAEVVQMAINYYGWHEFDSDPLRLTHKELRERWPDVVPEPETEPEPESDEESDETTEEEESEEDVEDSE